MSTERQEYSLLHQSEAIERYAARHCFSIIRTYCDGGRTGVTFQNRKGLQSLIQDVVQGAAQYKAVLVYDISRWGRFQDTDESAYYEFLCKSAGIPVHYVEEPFCNDTGMSSLIMKSLKRVMAGEYSRELGAKVFIAQRRLALMGFRQGGFPGYGLRRMLISGDRLPKQILKNGERKGIATDRVIQVPGPPEEVRCVREIYRLFIQEKMTFLGIAQELNRREIKYLGDSNWNMRAVKAVLTHPKYAGFNVYGRSSMKLYTPKVKVPESEWAVTPGAFEGLITPDTFAEVQKILGTCTRNRTNEELLNQLKALYTKEGKISMRLIQKIPGVASNSTYRARFGSMSQAFELAGVAGPGGYSRKGRLEEIRNIRAMRRKLMQDIVSSSMGSISIEDRGPRFRPRLRMGNGRLVSVVVARCCKGYRDAHRWLFKCAPSDTGLITVIARLNPNNDAFLDVFVTPPTPAVMSLRLSLKDPRLKSVVHLDDLKRLPLLIAEVSERRVRNNYWMLSEPSDAYASDRQLKRLAEFPKRWFIGRCINQRTFEKICTHKPVRHSVLAKCLKLLHQYEAEADREFKIGDKVTSA